MTCGPATAVERLIDLRLLAVIRGRTCNDAVEVAEALIDGGVLAIEVTFTTPDAERAMRRLGERHGERILLGAGTVTTARQAAAAADAGAAFLVSPGSDPELLSALRASGLATVPGALTPSEVQIAVRGGADAVKLFPGSLGGPAYLRALRAPFPDVRFIPTGGVSAANAGEWLAAGAVAVGAGGALAPPALDGDRPAVVERARELVEAVRRSVP
jgi:2-dehydro-3-deoxyphosphogluconate aldolase/(4S)-4-hydroxy-2-oxoglutarate aldolase